jgi:hypothetical protein
LFIALTLKNSLSHYFIGELTIRLILFSLIKKTFEMTSAAVPIIRRIPPPRVYGK